MSKGHSFYILIYRFFCLDEEVAGRNRNKIPKNHFFIILGEPQSQRKYFKKIIFIYITCFTILGELQVLSQGQRE